MSCPDPHRYRLGPGVRLRPLPEMGVCLAYTPARPALHRLNPPSWLIASLCDGRPYAEIAAAYRAALGEAVSDAVIRDGIGQLVTLGVVQGDLHPAVSRLPQGER